MLHATLNIPKTNVHPLISHQTNHLNKSSKTCCALLEKVLANLSIDSSIWIQECWVTSKKVNSSALYGHRMLFRGPNKFYFRVERERERERRETMFPV